MPLRQLANMYRSYMHMNRYRQILTVLVRYGFEDLVDSLRVEWHLRAGLRKRKRTAAHRLELGGRPARVRLALEELGPTFVKLGQYMSTRADLIPLPYIRELEKLQDEVTPFPVQQVRETLEEELSSPLEQLFSQFEEEPLAAASIGQVHRAQLMDGTEVAVKVQRPGIRRMVEADLEILVNLAQRLERNYEEMEFYQPTQLAREFRRNLMKEMDYRQEAGNINRFQEQFATEPHVHVPRVFLELGNPRILIMEYVPGIKASQVARLREEGYDCPLLARRGADLIFKQVFDHGFFHADPHPGNVFVLPENTICYLDFGVMGYIDRSTRAVFVEVLYGVVRRDPVRTSESLLKLARWEEVNRRWLEQDVAEFMGQHLYRPLKELEVGRILQQLFELVARHRLRLPTDLFLLARAVTAAEGLGALLDPDFDLVGTARPYVARLYRERFHPREVAGTLVSTGADYAHLLRDLPGELREIMGQVKQGKIRIQLEQRGMERLLFTYDQITNRLAFAIVLASLVIGSSLVVFSGVGPTWNEMPVIGIVGFMLAGLSGFWLLVSIIRHGHL